MFYTEHMRTLAKYWIVFIAVFAVHNTEEVLRNLPEWARAHGALTLFSSRTEVMIAVIFLTAAAATVGYTLERRSSRSSAVVLQVFCWIMAANAVGHIVGSLLYGSIMPGALSAVVMLPVFGWLATQARKLGKSK